jgi:hypothetical protein
MAQQDLIPSLVRSLLDDTRELIREELLLARLAAVERSCHRKPLNR